MKKQLTLFAYILVLLGSPAFAGNPDRGGGAGAAQLITNPFARTMGLGGVNTSAVRGAESFYTNIAGLAYTNGTEVTVSRMGYLVGAGVNINNLGIATALGEKGAGGVLGLGITSWDFGDIPITTFEQPDGTLPTFRPQVLNLNLSYAKKFSNSITGGALLRIISEGNADAKAKGACMDFGVQYQTSFNPKKKKLKKEDFRLGISVRNLGPDLTYRGDGLSFRGINSSTGADRRALFDADKFNLPSLVNIGLGYDMRLDRDDVNYFHRLSAYGNFNYNAFQSNTIGAGLEYSYKETVMFRSAYVYQDYSKFTYMKNDPLYKVPEFGIWAGASFQMNIGKNGTMFAIDYSYAPTRIFNGIHTFGLRLNI